MATVAVLGTASLLFLVTFRERPPDSTTAIRPTEEDLLDIAVASEEILLTESLMEEVVPKLGLPGR